MPYDITRLDVADTLQCSTDVRAAATGAACVETAARALCGCLFDAFVGARGDRAAVLVRFYATVPFRALPPDEQLFARRLLPDGAEPWPELRCLALLGTRGEVEAWNSRHQSHGHRAIPLPSETAVAQAPMIAQLFRQMGASIADIVAPAPRMLAPAKKLYNVFHVPEAQGSPHIPAQGDFVARHGVRSVVGFGGTLPWGELFSMILFSRAPIPEQSAARFRTLALDVRASLRDFEEHQLFESTEGPSSRAFSDASAASDARARSRSNTTLRSFNDAAGTEWKVWAVIPSATDLGSLTSGLSALRPASGDSWQKGWLLFESPTESRRLRPIPDDWSTALPADLDAMRQRAQPVRADLR